MNIKIKVTIFLFVILFSFGFVSHASADYYAQGVLESKNILSGADVTAISGFTVIAAVPANTTVSVKFSQDRVNYYNSSNVKDGWDSCANGTTAIDLSGLGWTGGLLFYKIQLTTTDIAVTPTVSNVQLDYTGTAVPAISGTTYYDQGILESKNLLSGADVTAINGFSVTAVVTPGTTVSVKFSQDRVNYYNSSGTKEGWDSCVNGANTINLSGLSWSGGSLFYKIKLESLIDNALAPSVSEVNIDYDGSSVPPISGITYYSPGILVSTDLLAGSGIKFNEGIDLFGWNITSLPFGTSIQAQFSQDGSAWYNSSGTLEGWDTLPVGRHMTDNNCLNLSSLGWEGAASFYYKLRFSSTVDNATTPVITEAGLFKFTEINSPDLPGGSTMTINMSLTDKMTNGLVGMWSFDGPDMDWANSSAEAIDRSVNGNDGDVVGATAARGKKGQALSFDGAGDYISVAHNALLNPSAITISFWIKKTSLPDNTTTILGKEDASNNSYYLTYLNEQRIRVGYNISTQLTGVRSMPINTWYHVVFTGDSSGGKIYFDGTLDNSSAVAWTAPNNSSALEIGHSLYGGYFPGTIDEVRVYDRALSPDEVGDLYRLGHAKVTN